MTTRTKTVTAEDLLQMPDDGYRCELVRGELRKMTPAGYDHGRIALKVTIPLGQYVWANNLGEVCAAETGFKISSNPDTVRAPDVAFISRERVEEVGDVDGYWPGAPDLAVEVISPNDSYTEVEEKAFDWLEAGTRLVLLLNPKERVVTAYRSLNDVTVLTEKDSLNGGEIVPGWSISVKELFV